MRIRLHLDHRVYLRSDLGLDTKIFHLFGQYRGRVAKQKEFGID